ncbi:MAG: serine hydrolase [Verrucomicrobium sp.]|nr:serine hydrolase [Verrucomicrobium sp.]
MPRLIAVLALLLICPLGRSWAADAAALAYLASTAEEVNNRLLAKSALLYDATTGQVLYARNIDKPLLPASTTKLLTALLLYEHNLGLRGAVTVVPGDTWVEPSHVPLIPGETVSINVLAHSLLIASDNDSAMALARYVSGSVPAFVSLMNKRAADLGCTRTHFVNPNGLPARGEYTTARDLLRIFQRTLAIPELREIMQTKTYWMVTAHGGQLLKNHNKLLGKYPGMGPAKTGWTERSRHTYAASATRDGHELQLIILNSPDKWKDASLLFNYGFANLPPLPAPPVLESASAAPSAPAR